MYDNVWSFTARVMTCKCGDSMWLLKAVVCRGALCIFGDGWISREFGALADRWLGCSLIVSDHRSKMIKDKNHMLC